MSVRSIDHINLVVSDLETSLAFYTGLLGFREIRRAHLTGEWIDAIVGLKNVDADVAYIVAPSGEPRIELLQYNNPMGDFSVSNSVANTRGLRHLALRVDDIDSAYNKLIENKVTIFGRPMQVPAGAVRHEAGQKTLLYFLDPDGVILELAEYK